MKNKNDTLNVLKGISCMLVVFIHAKFPGELGRIISALSRSGVALFFIISGYYLYTPDKTDMMRKLNKRITNIGMMTIGTFSFYFIWECFVCFIGAGWVDVLTYVKQIFAFDSIIKLLFLNYDSVIGHLWFLLALLYSYILLVPISKVYCKSFYLLAFIVIEAGIILTAFIKINELNIDPLLFRNVWFYGLPLVLIGCGIKQCEVWLNQTIATAGLIICAVLGPCIVMGEYLLLGGMELYNGTIISVLSSFLLAIRYPNLKSLNLFRIIGERYSTGVYLMHYFFIRLYLKFKTMVGANHILFDYIDPILIFAVTLCAVAMFNKILTIKNRKSTL